MVVSNPLMPFSLQPIQSFDSQQMQQLGFHRISDAVKYFAGVAVKDYGGQGGIEDN